MTENIDIGVNLKPTIDQGAVERGLNSLKSKFEQIFKGRGMPAAFMEPAAPRPSVTPGQMYIPGVGTMGKGTGMGVGRGMEEIYPLSKGGLQSSKILSANTDQMKKLTNAMEKASKTTEHAAGEAGKTAQEQHHDRQREEQTKKHEETRGGVGRGAAGLMEGAGKGLEKFAKELSGKIENVALRMIGVGEAVGHGNLVGALGQTISGVGSIMSGMFQGAGGLVSSVAHGAGGLISGVTGAVGHGIGSLGSGVPVLGGITGGLGGLIGGAGSLVGGLVSGGGGLLGGLISAIGPMINMPMQIQTALMNMKEGFFQQYSESVMPFKGLEGAIGTGKGWQQARAGAKYGMSRGEYGQVMATAARTTGGIEAAPMLARYQTAWGMDPGMLGGLIQSRQRYGGGTATDLEKTFAKGQELGWRGILATQYMQAIEQGTKKALASGHVMTSQDIEKLYGAWINFANLPTFKGEFGIQKVESLIAGIGQAGKLQSPAQVTMFRAVMLDMMKSGKRPDWWDVQKRAEDPKFLNQNIEALKSYIRSGYFVQTGMNKPETSHKYAFQRTLEGLGQAFSLIDVEAMWKHPIGAQTAKVGKAEGIAGREAAVQGSEAIKLAKRENEWKEKAIEVGSKLADTMEKYKEQMWSIYQALAPLAPNLDKLNDSVVNLLKSEGFKKMIETLSDISVKFADLSIKAMNTIGDLLTHFKPQIDQAANLLVKGISKMIDGIGDFVKRLGDSLIGLEGTFKSVTKIAEGFSHGLMEGINTFKNEMEKAKLRKYGIEGESEASLQLGLVTRGQKTLEKMRAYKGKQLPPELEAEYRDIAEATRGKIEASMSLLARWGPPILSPRNAAISRLGWQLRQEPDVVSTESKIEVLSKGLEKLEDVIPETVSERGEYGTLLAEKAAKAGERKSRSAGGFKFTDKKEGDVGTIPENMSSELGFATGGIVNMPLSLRDRAGNVLQLAEREPEYIIPRSRLAAAAGFAEQKFQFSRDVSQKGAGQVDFKDILGQYIDGIADAVRENMKSIVHTPRISDVQIMSKNYLDSRFNVRLEIEAASASVPLNPK